MEHMHCKACGWAFAEGETILADGKGDLFHEGGCVKRPFLTKWAYEGDKMLVADADSDLFDHLALRGAKGWELCGMLPLNDGVLQLIFKRPSLTASA